MPRLVKLVLWTVALGYVGIVAAVKGAEKQMVFHPADRAVTPPSGVFKLRERTVRYRATDGTRLSAWIIPAAAGDSSGMWLLVCHGNYGNIGYGERPEFYAFTRDIGVNLFAFDYRGFGESEGEPDERGMYADALASWRYLTDSLHVPGDHIVIFGHSLGSGVATKLATEVDAAALVLEGAFTSVVDRGQELYPLLPVKLIGSQRFPSLERMPAITEPKLLLHSPEDDVIPFAHSERLFAAAKEPKRLVAVRGGHMDAFSADKETYYGALREIVQRVTPVGGSGAGQIAAPALLH